MTDAPQAPAIIAHRGASAERPENTVAAFRLALEQGADAIETDVVLTSDGVPVLRHDLLLDDTTDAATRHPEAVRRRESAGEVLEGRFALDRTAEEIAGLRAHERLPAVRPASARHDGQPVPTLDELLELLADAPGAPAPIVEIKHAALHRATGLDIAAAVRASLLRTAPAGGWGDRVTIESFEAGVLDELAGLPARRVLLLDGRGAPADDPAGPDYDAIAADPARLAGRFDGISVDARRFLRDPGLPERAADAGLDLLVWTLRAENRFLPPEHRIGDDPAAHGDVLAAWAPFLGPASPLAGVFTDHPALARRIRTALASG